VSEPDSKRLSEPSEAEEPRYAQLEVGDQLVVYDRHNHQAWVQSDAAVETDSMV
jgi:hypothetical protein